MRIATCPFASLILATLVSAHAAAPKEPELNRYESLWTDSLFTSKPPAVVPPDQPNALKDYTLASLCRIQHGWHVVLLHKKDRSKRLRLTPYGFTKSGFRVVSVENPSTREARVEIHADGQKGWVHFESKFLTIRKAAPARGARPALSTPPIPGYKSPKVRKKPVSAKM